MAFLPSPANLCVKGKSNIPVSKFLPGACGSNVSLQRLMKYKGEFPNNPRNDLTNMLYIMNTICSFAFTLEYFSGYGIFWVSDAPGGQIIL